MENKLLPCPHCGGRAVMVEGRRPENVGRYSATCGQCFCATRWEISPENATFDWNRRATPANPPLTLEQLREMDGEPVWIMNLVTNRGEYCVISSTRHYAAFFTDMSAALYAAYGKTWLAYAHKPEKEDA